MSKIINIKEIKYTQGFFDSVKVWIKINNLKIDIGEYKTGQFAYNKVGVKLRIPNQAEYFQLIIHPTIVNMHTSSHSVQDSIDHNLSRSSIRVQTELGLFAVKMLYEQERIMLSVLSDQDDLDLDNIQEQQDSKSFNSESDSRYSSKNLKQNIDNQRTVKIKKWHMHPDESRQIKKIRMF